MKLPPWYMTPTFQVFLVGFTFFCTPGIFTALTNLGAGGIQDVSLADTANGTLYGLFALAGFVSGAICNILGPPVALFIGTLGYALYVGALWCHQTQGTKWFLILAGALLGLSASLLWSAQGEIVMGYPLEKDKGKAFSLFWAMLQFGAFIGSVVALAINIESGKLQAVSTSTYIAFLVIIFIGTTSTFLVLGPNRVIRADGSLVKLQGRATFRDEVVGTFQVFFDWRMLTLLPMSFASNFAYAYQGAVNAARFDGATRALNSTLSAVGAIVGATLFGYLVLDSKRFPRRTRGYIGLAVVSVMIIIVRASALSWQLTFTRANAGPENLINYKHKAYMTKAPLYFFFYFVDACYQALVYWTMSALTNDALRLARCAGFYSAMQSAGSAVSFGIDAVKIPFLNELLAGWSIMMVSFPLAFLVIRSIKETNYDDEDRVFVDDLGAHASERKSRDGSIVPDTMHDVT
ncbi:MFS general substrate transporter [Gautieria morchelliformis]|nr:MFS general substrate transporter [Gautieria morchelliformis]